MAHKKKSAPNHHEIKEFKSKKLLTSREFAEAISSGKIPNQHIGKKSTAVLQQELFSLINTKEAFRKQTWHMKFKAVKELSIEYGVWTGFIQKYDLARLHLD